MDEVDTERFRLRRFAELLVAEGECEVHDAPIALLDLAAVLDGNPKAVWFRAVGPERAELIGNVMGGRRRLALALGTDEAGLPAELRRRIDHPVAPVRVARTQAPVQEVVRLGAEADLCDLPVHLQHGEDGAPYISAGIDFAVSPANGWTNAGCRRIMVRGPQSAGIDLNAPSDLRALYQEYVARGEPLPVAYAVGSHPADFLASVAATPPIDELDVIGGLRGAPLPIVKCVTCEVWVPADAEYIIEGYLDPRGLVEPEGPYGEYIGYYGVVKKNPVFHVTAITHRKDALFQTATIGGKHLGRTDTALLTAVKTEAAVWAALMQGVREPVAVCATSSSGGMYNVRVSLRQRVPGEARNAIASVFGSTADVKHVFVFDADIDVFSADHVDWAMATRFQGDRDLMVLGGFRAVPLDPSLLGGRTGAKVGFDCTIPFGKAGSFDYRVPMPPEMPDRARRSVADAVRAGPASFLELMAAAGTRDGREVIRELDRLDQAGGLTRREDGKYIIKERKP